MSFNAVRVNKILAKISKATVYYICPCIFQVFILIPIIFVLVSIYLVIGPIIEDPKIELLYAFLFIVGGLVFYFPLVVFKLDRGCFGR